MSLFKSNLCSSCFKKNQNLIKEASQSFLYLKRGIEQQVARPCSGDDTSFQFPIKLHE